MKEFDHRLNVCWWALRVGLGAGPIIAGVDKYFNKLTDWSMYLIFSRTNPLCVAF
jgi:hypothetical protein